MVNEFENGGKKGSDLANRLVTSPKQVKTRLSKRAITNTVVANAYTFIDSDAEAIVFGKVSFCENFTFISAAKNKVVIFEDCSFHSRIYLYGSENANVIFRNCRMREPVISERKGGFIDMVGCTPLDPGADYESFIDKLPLRELSACN